MWKKPCIYINPYPDIIIEQIHQQEKSLEQQSLTMQ